MKLKRKVAKLDEVPEAHRGQYQQSGDVFELKDEFEVPDPVDVTGLTKNRDAILVEKQALEARYAGIDPEAARQALKAIQDGKTKDLEGKGQWDQLKVQLETAHGTEKKNLETRIEQLTGALQNQMIEAAAMTVLAATGVARPKLLLPDGGGGPIRSQVKVVEEPAGSGNFVAKVLDSAGQPRFMDATKGTPLAQLVEELMASDDYGAAWDAPNAGGSGAPAGGSGARGGQRQNSIKRSQFEALPPNKRMEHIKAGGAVVD